MEKTEKIKQLRKKNKGSPLENPFRYKIFEEAYMLLKLKEQIKQTDILEQKKRVDFEIYQSLYWNALKAVFRKCKEDITDKEMEDILGKMFENEYDWMIERMGA